jgi:hypothetical protein
MTELSLCTGLGKSGIMPPMKYWEIVADKLSAAGSSWGYCSAVTKDGWRWIVDAHRDDSRRYIVHVRFRSWGRCCSDWGEPTYDSSR